MSYFDCRPKIPVSGLPIAVEITVKLATPQIIFILILSLPVLVFDTLCAEEHVSPKTGRPLSPLANTGVWKEGVFQTERVDLPQFTGRFGNKFFHLSGVPNDVTADREGNYLYEVSDSRFAWPHIYFHFHRQITYFNRLLEEAGCKKLENVEVRVVAEKPGIEPSAESDAESIDIRFQSPAFDPTIIAHEIGHAVHFSCVGQRKGLEPSNTSKVDLKTYYEWLGITEGVANIFASLYANDPLVAKQSRKNLAYNVDTKLVYPKLKTRQDRLKDEIGSEEFSRNYPTTVEERKKELEIESKTGSLEYSDPYLASAVFTQPLWKAAQKYGKRKVELTLLESLSKTRNIISYSDFAEELVKKAKDVELQKYLQSEFRARGLLK